MCVCVCSVVCACTVCVYVCVCVVYVCVICGCVCKYVTMCVSTKMSRQQIIPLHTCSNSPLVACITPRCCNGSVFDGWAWLN